jgi:hypothetical protein
MESAKKTFGLHIQIILLVAACLMFAGAYSQSPLFSSNQNTYFVRGLAAAGYGHLSSDWLAQQTDHTPVFSALVTLVHSHGSHWMFYGLHGVLATIYILSLYVIANRAVSGALPILSSSLFFAVITLLHFPWLATPFTNSMHGLWRWIPKLQVLASLSTQGMAGQYILGPFLQPSAFGVLLIASIALFIWKKESMAVSCAVLAATIHPTYVLHAALLTGVYVTVLLSERNTRKALTTGGLALLLISPIVLYVLLFLSPTSSSILGRAQTILVEERIPHHAKASVWFSQGTGIQLGIILGGLLSARRCKRLFIVLVLCAVGFILLTCVQIASGSQSLALLSPWRVSTWLVPASTAIMVRLVSSTGTKFIHTIPAEPIRRVMATLVTVLSIICLTGASIAGTWYTVTKASSSEDRASVISYAKTHSNPDHTYLIPLGFTRFRLGAGVPVFVDWKSHPYKDVELVEWYERIRLARAFYEATSADIANAALAEIQKRAEITHVVVEAGAPDLPMNLRLLYEGQDGLVYEVIRDENVEQSNALEEE